MTVDNLFDDRVGSAIIGIRLSVTIHPITPSVDQQASLAALFRNRYSRRMLPLRHLQGILAGLLLIAGISYIIVPAHPDGSAHGIWFSIGFLVGAPLFLMCLLFSRQSWVLMATIMYGTIGLALDMATLVQEATLTEMRVAVIILEGLSGALNFLLITCGGYAFLSGTLVGQPVATHPPNPPSPVSS